MLKINVLGTGMIPRGLGLAPRIEPFNADRMLIYTILNTKGLSVNYFNPDKKRMEPLTKKNLQKVFDKYGDWQGSMDDVKESINTNPHVPGIEDNKNPQEKKEESAEETSTPVVPENPVVNNSTTTVPEVNNEQKPDEIKEEVSEKSDAPVDLSKEAIDNTQEKKEESAVPVVVQQPSSASGNNGGGLKPVNSPENRANNNPKNNNQKK